jgi:hypothetical protein
MSANPTHSDMKLRQVADELANIRRGVDWTAPPPRTLYAALRSTENVAREALGDRLADDFCHKGKFTRLSDAE